VNPRPTLLKPVGPASLADEEDFQLGDIRVRPSLREVAAGGAWMFPAGSGGDAVAAAAERALASRAVRLRRRTINTYTWRVVASQIERVIDEAGNGG